MGTDLILACHGQSAQKDGGRVLGWWADVSLSPAGARQALLLAGRLRDSFDVDALYTSPLQRARETAETVSYMVKVTPEVEAGLSELDGGTLSGLSYEEAKSRYPDLIERGGSQANRRLPDGESYADLHRRADRALTRILKQNPGRLVVAITHGGPIIAYLRAFLGFSWDARGKPRFRCDAASIHHLRLDDNGEKTVVCLNDTSHLLAMSR